MFRPVAFVIPLVAAMTACTPVPVPAPDGTPDTPMSWDDHGKLPRGTADATLRYGADPYQVVDLWLPTGPGPHPVVLMVHGGCWTTGIADRTLMNPIATDLRARGFAVWNIDYRGVDRPGGGYPGTFADVAAAAALLTRDGPRYRLDLDRVVAVGHSAGGHLALWLAGRARVPAGSPLATAPTDPPLRGVVSLGGLPDLEQAAREQQGCGAEPVRALVDSGRRGDSAWADTSVPRLAPIGVSQHLINGDADRIIPTHFAADYVARMRAAGDTPTAEVVANTGHVELIAPTTPAWRHAVAAITRFTTP